MKSINVDSAFNKVGEAALKGIRFHDGRNKDNMRLFKCTCEDDDVSFVCASNIPTYRYLSKQPEQPHLLHFDPLMELAKEYNDHFKKIL